MSALTASPAGQSAVSPILPSSRVKSDTNPGIFRKKKNPRDVYGRLSMQMEIKHPTLTNWKSRVWNRNIAVV